MWIYCIVYTTHKLVKICFGFKCTVGFDQGIFIKRTVVCSIFFLLQLFTMINFQKIIHYHIVAGTICNQVMHIGKKIYFIHEFKDVETIQRLILQVKWMNVCLKQFLCRTNGQSFAFNLHRSIVITHLNHIITNFLQTNFHVWMSLNNFSDCSLQSIDIHTLESCITRNIIYDGIRIHQAIKVHASLAIRHRIVFLYRMRFEGYFFFNDVFSIRSKSSQFTYRWVLHNLLHHQMQAQLLLKFSSQTHTQ